MKNSFDPFSKQNLFYTYKLNIFKKEINQILLLVKNKKFKNNNQATTYKALNVLNFPILKNLRKQVIDILNKHKLYLENNWAQLYNKEDKHTVHIHEYSYLSGIIYLTNSESPTIFYDKKFNNFKYQGKKNTLLLFPSSIPHEVDSLIKDEQRLIISFNTKEQE